jgi:glucose-6-phosphate isomerase
MLGGSHARVIWAYCDRLASLGDWFCQLWGESLGKPRGDGTLGQQPVRAIGSTDQHSLLQLFMEGSPDKHLTFLTVGGPRPSLVVPDLSDLDPDLKEFAGHEVFEVFEALRAGTMAGLVEAGRPVDRIHVPTLDEEALGALFAHFEVETALAGYLLGIDPFDQPGVEAGKRFAHGLLGRPGMEDWGRRARAILGEEGA